MTTYLPREVARSAAFRIGGPICLLCVLALSGGCGRDLSERAASEPTRSPEASRAAPFEGDWHGEVALDDRKYVLRLSFSGHDELTADNRLVLASENSPGGWQEYPGPVCDYQYEVVGSGRDEGELVVTMVSIRIEGVERISDQNKAPERWPYRVKSADVMEITKHSGGQTRTFVMHRQ